MSVDPSSNSLEIKTDISANSLESTKDPSANIVKKPENTAEKKTPYSSYSATQNINAALTDLVTADNAIIVLIVLAIFVILYSTLSQMFPSSAETGNNSFVRAYSLAINIVLILAFFSEIWYLYATYLTSNTLGEIVQTMIEWTRRFYEDPTSLFSNIFVLVGFYIFMKLLMVPMNANKPIMIEILETKLWVTLISLIVIDCMIYIIKIPLVDMVFDRMQEVAAKIFKDSLPVPVTGPVVPKKSGPQPEVFNISNNLYTYDDARAICSAYDASLATYDQIENSYSSGGEWCNYGWSANQMALFPTQKSTWTNLQSDERHKNDCGRPGINGGYISNPNVKFGVNCFGIKPKPSAADLARMNAKAGSVMPKTARDAVIDAKVNFWKKNADQFLEVTSFDKKRWSGYNTTSA